MNLHCLKYKVKSVTEARSLDKMCSSFTGALLFILV